MHIRDAIPLSYPFFLRQMTFGDHPEIEIESDDFDLIKRAKEVLAEAKAFEERYDALLQNYIEFEKDIAAICINEMVRGDDGYEDVYVVLRDLNIRISILLSATRVYVDHLISNAAKFSTDDWNAPKYVKKTIDKFRKDKYFRLGEGLRNYAQHVGVPVSDAVIGGQWKISKGMKDTSYHAISITSSKEDLSRKHELARKTLPEFDDDNIDLKFAIGKYIAALGKMHVELRKGFGERIEQSRKCFQCHVGQYEKLNDCCDTPSVLTAIRVEEGAIAEEIQIHLNWDDVRLRLVRRNLGLRDFSISYATTISPTVLEMERNQVDQR